MFCIFLKFRSHYIFTKSSVPAQENDTALLTSKQFPPSQCRCISWHYHMYGRSMGELSVYIKDSVGSKRILWNKKGDQGNRWILGSATISNVAMTSYQVRFGLELLCGQPWNIVMRYAGFLKTCSNWLAITENNVVYSHVNLFIKVWLGLGLDLELN